MLVLHRMGLGTRLSQPDARLGLRLGRPSVSASCSKSTLLWKCRGGGGGGVTCMTSLPRPVPDFYLAAMEWPGDEVRSRPEKCVPCEHECKSCSQAVPSPVLQ